MDKYKNKTSQSEKYNSSNIRCYFKHWNKFLAMIF